MRTTGSVLRSSKLLSWGMAAILALVATPALAQVTAGYSEYYVPGGEDEMHLAFRTLGGNTISASTHATITITAWADDTTVYYDHWEDGLDFDPNNPGTADATFTLATVGSVMILDDTPAGGIPIPRNPANTYYDGGDRIYVAGGAVTVARASYPQVRAGVNPGLSVQAVAWEVYPVKPQLTTYVLPFGENLSGSFSDFLRTYVLVQATANGTTFTVDLNGDGTADRLDQNFDGDTVDAGDTTTVTLQAGQTFFIGNVPVNPTPLPRGARATINSGAVVQGSSTLQVKFVIGDPGATYETRGISAFPRGYWTRDYYAPVNEPAGGPVTDIFLYNPNAATITVTWETQAGSGSFDILSGATVSYLALAGALPTTGGVYLRGSDVFWGVSTIDSTGPTNEWAYSLLPTTLLYSEHFLGWAPGGADGNDSGVFLTVVQDNTTVFVDTNADGTADQTYTLSRLQTQYITDPDGDLSGTRFWATGPFTMAFGQNPDTAPAQATSGDLGYVAIPGTDFISMVLSVEKSASPEIVGTAAGSQTEFTIEVSSGSYSVDDVSVLDILPPGWRYVSGSAEITLADLSTVSGGPADPTPIPTYADLFGAVSFANNDSTPAGASWSTDWIEDGEEDGTGAGRVMVLTDGGVAPNVTALRFENSSRALARMADLSLFPGGSLQFVYRRQGTDAANETLDVQVCADATYNAAPTGITCATGWVSAPAVPGFAGTDATYQAYSVDLGSLLPGALDSATFAVRFSTADGSSLDNNDYIWVDDVRIVPKAELLWPASTLGSMAANQTIRITFTAETTIPLAEGTLSENRVTAIGTRTVGGVVQTFTTTHFAFVLSSDAAVEITKASSVAETTPVYPGDTLTYTVTVTNPAGAAMLTGVSLYDALPMGVRAAAGSTTLSASSSGDRFATSSYDNDDGTRAWAGAWTELDNGSALTGDILITGGQLRLHGDAAARSITRGVDLGGTGATWATLTFDHTTSNNLEPDDQIVVQYRTGGGGGFTALATYSDDVSGSATFVIPLASPANLTEIRVAIPGGSYTGFNEYFYVDNLFLTYDQPVAGGDPPALLSASSGYAIPAGESLTATFDVTVDDPLPTGITSLTNTASTTSTQYPIQVSASATNVVTNPSVQSASVAGRVWLDSDADGTQDFSEPGIANVEVTLKDQWGTPLATLYTDVGGRYLFTNVEPGVGYYVEVGSGLPAGVTQSYPDAATYGNHRSIPFDLVAGEDESGVDLGYRPAAGTVLFGDQVWVDANANGLRDPGEVALPGATVDLFLDANGNGVLEAGETTPVATTTSDVAGHYLLSVTGLSGGEDYFVGVRAVGGFTLTTAGTYYFADVVAGSAYLTADFGFAGSGVSTYTISDRVWFDMDASQAPNGTETGIAGVTVDLLDASLNVIATAVSAADGTFTFSGVQNGNYTVRISDTSGLLVDYTGTTPRAVARQYAQTVAGASIDNIGSPSFGLRPTRSIGDTVFFDVNGDGDQDSGEGGIPGVVVELYQGGVPLYSTTTDANGRYYFAGLVDGSYVVHVAPLAGYAFTGSDAYPGVPGLQLDATIAGGASYWDADFGFQATNPRTLAGIVWNDLNSDGIVSIGETRIAGVTLEVLLGGTLFATATTDANGAYFVAGLAEGTYTVALTDINGVLTGLVPTYEATGGTAGPFDRLETVLLSGADVTNLNFGFRPPAVTFANVAAFEAYLADGSVVVEWRTSVEAGTAGFRLSRLGLDGWSWTPLHERLLPALVGHPQGGRYRFVDEGASAQAGTRLVYLLEDVDLRGRRQAHGPYAVVLGDEGRAARASEPRRESGRATFTREPVRRSRASLERAGTAAVAQRQAARAAAAGGGWIEVATGAPGVYHLSAEEIAAPVGASPSTVRGLIATRRLALSHRGRPVSYLPDPQSAGISFYAEPVQSLYTARNVYQVGLGAGQTIEEIGSARPGAWGFAGVPATAFDETVHREEDVFSAMSAIQDPETDFWFWAYAFGGYPGLDRAAVTVPATAVAGTGVASLTLRVVGGTDEAAELDHRVTVSWNGDVVGESSWGGLGPHLIEIPLGAVDVLEGDNTLELRALSQAGVGLSIVYLDSVDLAYAREYHALGDEIFFSAPAGAAVEVSGFSSPEVLLFDVTKPTQPRLVAHASEGAPGGGYLIRVGVPSARSSRRYLALTRSRLRGALGVSASRMPSLRNPENRAEYVLITPDSLEDAAQVLADYRNSRGITTKVVPLAGVYSEFNGGIAEPQAIREFLRYATASWRIPPRYVTLVGRGTWDYKNLTGVGDNLVPPLLAGSANGLFASDVRLADLASDDGVPEVAIGRIPVLTAEELLDYVDKIERHDGAPEETWQRLALMTADDPDAAGSFTTDSDRVAALLPPDYLAQKVYLSTTPPATGRAAIRDAVNAGVGVFNYIGHGGLDRFADEGLWRSDDVASLVNADRLPVVLAMTCAAGNFATPGYPSLAEELALKKDGGAFAVWAPTGLSENALAVSLDESFFRAAFSDGEKVLGDVIVRALSELRGWGAVPMRYMYNLLGEPVARLPETGAAPTLQ